MRSQEAIGSSFVVRYKRHRHCRLSWDQGHDHNDLKRRFIDLQRSMELSRSSPTKEMVANWRAERLAIEADEPPVNRVAHALCYNELVRSKSE